MMFGRHQIWNTCCLKLKDTKQLSQPDKIPPFQRPRVLVFITCLCWRMLMPCLFSASGPLVRHRFQQQKKRIWLNRYELDLLSIISYVLNHFSLLLILPKCQFRNQYPTLRLENTCIELQKGS